jgi:hypothetical protein
VTACLDLCLISDCVWKLSLNCLVVN